jgi:hypothetical protein
MSVSPRIFEIVMFAVSARTKRGYGILLRQEGFSFGTGTPGKVAGSIHIGTNPA